MKKEVLFFRLVVPIIIGLFVGIIFYLFGKGVKYFFGEGVLFISILVIAILIGIYPYCKKLYKKYFSNSR